MIGKLVGTATALAALIAVPISAETYAGGQLASDVRAAAGHLAPGTTVTRAEPHGRPFLGALLADEVSSAYVDIHGPTGTTTTTLILQRLHRDTGRVRSVLWFPRLPNPTGLVPVLAPSGAYSPRGTTSLDGRQAQVSYVAALSGGVLRVRPESVTVDGQARTAAELPARWLAALTPEPVALPAADPLSVRAVSVGKQDITVELKGEDVDTTTTRPAAGTS